MAMKLSSKSSTASLEEVIEEVSNFKHEYLEMVVPCLSKGVMTELRLDDFKDAFKVILFYPNDFNRLIKEEIHDLNQRLPQFKALTCQVLVCSTDSVHVHLAWQKVDEPESDEHLGIVPDFPFLGDKTQRFCRSLNVLNEDDGTAMHALYIINPKGDLVYQDFLDMTARFDFDDVLQKLKTNSCESQHNAVLGSQEPSRPCSADQSKIDEGIKAHHEVTSIKKDEMDAAPSRTSKAVLQPIDKPKEAANSKMEEKSKKEAKTKKKKGCIIL